MDHVKKLDEIPSTPEIKHCEKHGDYEVKYQPFGKKVWVFDVCTKCVAEQKELDERKRIEDQEKQDRENKLKLRESRRVNAGISKRNLYKTFDDYMVSSPGQQLAKDSMMTFVKNFPTDKNLLLLGSVGTGKTLLASAALDQLVDKFNCRIKKVSEIVREFKNSWAKDTDFNEDDVADHYIGLDLLIIDEVGTQFGSDTEKLFIFEVIDGRYQDMKPTILISNLDVDGVGEVIGQRCIDRLREGGGSMIAFDWDSQRK